MTTINDGGPAFPVLSYEYKATGDLHPSPTMQSGMSLRDWFAGMALQGMYSNGNMVDNFSNHKGMSEEAYECADAMIAARNQ